MSTSADISSLALSLAGRYRIEGEVGRGGMATVFRARDLRHDRTVALKVLRPDVAHWVGPERFLREIEIEARLHHPHILTLLDSGESDGSVWYAMPFVDGESLRERLDREQQLSIEQALEIVRQVGDALSYAHQQGVVHRDIKPENILLGDGHAYLADFGVAKAARRSGAETLTGTGVAVGTAVYMSPEQSSGYDRVDERSDQYSLACVLYEMLAGEPPYSGPNPVSILAKKVNDTAPRVTVVRDTAPLGVDRAISRALSRTPADRFDSVRDFLEALEQDAPAPRRAERRRVGLVAGLAAAVALVAGAVVLGQQGWPIPGGILSLVILPVENASGLQDDEPIVASLRDDISDQLGRIVDVSLRSRTSALRVAQSAEPLSAVAEMLDVDAVVETSFTRAGDSLRMRLSLVRTRPEEEVVWSESFEGSEDDLLAMVNDVVGALAQELGAAPALAEAQLSKPSRAVSPEAYEAYSRGWYERSRYTDEGLLAAVDLFQTAIQLAPDYALAHAALAEVYGSLPYYVAVSPMETMPLAKMAANRALELDPDLAPAHTALGWATMAHDLDFQQAEYHFTQALELDPGYAVGHMWYSWFLVIHRRFEEALVHEYAAREADPLAPRVAQHLAVVYHAQRDFERVIEISLGVLEQHPAFARAYLDLGEGYLHTGRFDEAIVAFEHVLDLTGDDSGGATGVLPRLGAALAYAGRSDEAVRILQQLEERSRTRYVPALAFAEIHMALGAADTALGYIEQAYEARDGDVMIMGVWPKWDPIRDHPRFQNAVRRAGLPRS